MQTSEFILVFALMSRYFICRTSGAVVNINLAGFQDGILSVPQNNEIGEIQVDLSEAVTSVQATVVCSSLETGPGLTAVEFQNSSAPVGTTQVDVTFRIVSPGRPVTIQCSAQSEGSNIQFTLLGSKGNNGSLRVVKAPTVHICPDVILVHKYLLKTTVQVQFSEKIKDFGIKVKCSVVEPEPGGPAVLQLRFTETSVGPDVITAQIPYEIVALGVPVQVVCTAQSTNLTEIPVPPEPPVPIPSSSVNQTVLSDSVNQTVLPSSVNQTSVSASFPISTVTASSSFIGGGAKKRRRRSILSSNRTVLQYQFNTSAVNFKSANCPGYPGEVSVKREPDTCGWRMRMADADGKMWLKKNADETKKKNSNRVKRERGMTKKRPPVTFALDVSPLRIIPRAGFIRAPNGSFSAILTLDQPADNTVDIKCSLDIVSPGAELSNTSGLCSNAPTDKLTFVNSTVEIKLNTVLIQFKTNELFKKIMLTLSGSPAWRAADLVRVTCCNQDTGLSLRYVNESAVAFIGVEVRKLQPVDWNSITSGQRKATLVSNIDLTCPCNLKENSCDTGCCCDQDCSDFETKSSTCVPGFFGGATSERPFEFSCQASWPDSRDWQPFLCVAINNSPFTGYFYNLTSPPLAQDSTSFNTLARNKKRESFTFVESEERRTVVSSGLYTLGTSVKTAANAEDANYARATVGVLSLPQTVFNGLCSQDVPVRFLEQVSSRCVLELEESLCNPQSSWSALNYLMPIKLSRPTCVLPPSVLAQGRLNETGGPPELVRTDVQYYCTDITAFISSAAEESKNSLTSNSSSLFESSAQEGADLTRCAFDDGETLPPAPVFNKTTRLCANVVVRVQYEFEWRDRRIDAVKVRVTLGNVQIPAVKTNTGLATSADAVNTISQNFSVKFIHSPLLNSSSVGEAPFQRSGNPGYLLGRPVLSRLENSSGQVIAGKLQLWSPGPDSLCAGSTLTPILYGKDTFSGCLLRLSFEDMRNCSYLREMVLINQNRLIQATHVGRSGNANLSVLADWLPVIREPISNNSEPFSKEGTCPDIPSGVVIEMLVTDAGKYGDVPQMEIVGTRIKFQFSTWQFKCVSGASCSAPNDTDAEVTQVVPSPSATPVAAALSAVLNTSHSTLPLLSSSSVFSPNFIDPSLLSAASSANNNVSNITASSRSSPNAIHSSLLSPTASSLTSHLTVSSSVSPATNRTVSARNYPPHFQFFMVTSFVVFIKVPAVKSQPVKRSVDQTGICYRDVCKEELFLPLTEAYQGEPREKSLALSLFLIFLALVTFAVTRPWG